MILDSVAVWPLFVAVAFTKYIPFGTGLALVPKVLVHDPGQGFVPAVMAGFVAAPLVFLISTVTVENWVAVPEIVNTPLLKTRPDSWSMWTVRGVANTSGDAAISSVSALLFSALGAVLAVGAALFSVSASVFSSKFFFLNCFLAAATAAGPAFGFFFLATRRFPFSQVGSVPGDSRGRCGKKRSRGRRTIPGRRAGRTAGAVRPPWAGTT